MKIKFEMHSFQFHYFLLFFFFFKQDVFLAWVCIIKNFIHLRMYILSNDLPDDSKHLLQLIGPFNEPTNSVFGIV